MAHLRTVSDDERPAPPATPKTITEALNGGPRGVLAAMRHSLAKKLDASEISSNAIASAYKELRELDRLIRSIDAAQAEKDGPNARHGDEVFNPQAI